MRIRPIHFVFFEVFVDHCQQHFSRKLKLITTMFAFVYNNYSITMIYVYACLFILFCYATNAMFLSFFCVKRAGLCSSFCLLCPPDLCLCINPFIRLSDDQIIAFISYPSIYIKEYPISPPFMCILMTFPFETRERV